MKWSFEKKFYGQATGLNIESLANYLVSGSYLLPETLFNGLYRQVYRIGDNDIQIADFSDPFINILDAQKPTGKFALNFSGGFDSSILAKLYDSPEVDLIHFLGPETKKAKALSEQLEASLHTIDLSDDEYIELINELTPKLREPYGYEDIIFAYKANKKAKSLGHNLIVTGDAGDAILGGAQSGPYTLKSHSIWRSLEPSLILNLNTLQPFAHSLMRSWGYSNIPLKQRGRDKQYASIVCERLKMPEVVYNQKKAFWAGSVEKTKSEKVTKYMLDTVKNSRYSCLLDLNLERSFTNAFYFRVYSLSKWLEENYNEKLSEFEINKLTKVVDRLNRRRNSFYKLVKGLMPPMLYNAIKRKI